MSICIFIYWWRNEDIIFTLVASKVEQGIAAAAAAASAGQRLATAALPSVPEVPSASPLATASEQLLAKAALGIQFVQLAAALGIDVSVLRHAATAATSAAPVPPAGPVLQPILLPAASAAPPVKLFAPTLAQPATGLAPAAPVQQEPPAVALALAAAINSRSHPREYKLFQRACHNSHELASSWAAGGPKRMKTFLNFLQSGCNSEATEAMMASEATKGKETRWEGEYLSEECILKALRFDQLKAQTFMARKRTEEDGVIIDPNDGVTEKFFWASSQKSTSTVAQKETMVVRAAAEPNDVFVNMMTGMTSASLAVDDSSSCYSSRFADSQGGVFSTPDAGHRRPVEELTGPKKTPPAKKAKVAEEASLSMEEALEKDPRAYAASWSNGLMNDIGKGEITAMKLAGMDCQEELRGKLCASAAAQGYGTPSCMPD